VHVIALSEMQKFHVSYFKIILPEADMLSKTRTPTKTITKWQR
jgi:hypothetical protein